MLEDIEEEGSLLGYVNDLKCQEYNLLDHINFLQFQVDQYMAMTVNPATKVEALTPQAWIASLQPSGLLNLLQIPHFGRSNEINAVVKVLLSCINGGNLWLDRIIDITIDLIHQITGLSKIGADLATHFVGKDQDIKLAVRLIRKYSLTRGGQAYGATQIEVKSLRFTVQLLAGRVLQKCRPNQVLGPKIELVNTARDGVQYNWSFYLLNQFNEDCRVAQDQNQPFHYARLLILIGFVGWKEPKQGLFLNTYLNFRGAHFANLWVTLDAEKHDANNMAFYYYYDQLCKAISISLHVTCEVPNTYGKIMRFAADQHHIYLQPRAQKGGDRHIGYYKMTQEDIEQVIKYQPEIWATTEENPKEEKEKESEKEPTKDQEKDKAKEKDKGKATLGEK